MLVVFTFLFPAAALFSDSAEEQQVWFSPFAFFDSADHVVFSVLFLDSAEQQLCFSRFAFVDSAEE